MSTLRSSILLLGIFLAAGTVFGQGTVPRSPLDLVPAEALLCWYGEALPDAPPPGTDSTTLQALLELGTRYAAGGGDSQARFGLRVAEMFTHMIRHPHALALIDARAVPVAGAPESRRVDRLRAALVVQCGSHMEPFLRIVQKAVNEQTNAGTGTLTAHESHGWRYQELRDARLPEWTVVAWGQIDGFFVLTVGAEVWPLIAATAAGERVSLSRDPWYAAARGRGEDPALIEIFVGAEGLRERLDDVLEGRASAFFAAWEAESLTRAHWALGFRERALYCHAHFLVGEETRRRVYADARVSNPVLLATVPPEARYAVYEVPIGRLLPQFFSGLVALQGPKERANIERLWAEIQQQHEFNLERDLLPHLGDRIVLHNSPPHPLRFPLATTILIQIRSEPATVQRAVERFCRAWQATIIAATQQSGVRPPLVLQRDTDGVWFVRFQTGGADWFGLAGPAWTVTDRYIVASWSPLALRQYLGGIGAAAGQRLPALPRTLPPAETE